MSPLRRRRAGGFTLIELMLVVATVGILAAVSVANFNRVLMKTRDRRRKAELRMLQRSIELFRSDTLAYPNDIIGCDTSAGRTTEIPCGLTLTNDWDPGDGIGEIRVAGYYRNLPHDPINNRARNFTYNYEPVENQTQFGVTCGPGCAYILSARLEDPSDKDATPGCNACNAADNFCLTGGNAQLFSGC